MARIPTYEIDSVINDLDMLLGTDYNDNEFTKNFTLSGVAEYVIDKLIEPNAVQSCIPVFRNTGDVQGGNATRITSSIINQNIYPNGTNISIAGTLDVEKKVVIKGNSGGSGSLQLNCEQNSHGVQIQGPPHTAGATYTLVLPVDVGMGGQVLTTEGTGGQLYWSDKDDDNLNIAGDTNTGVIDLDTQTLTISGGTLINTSVLPDGGQNIVIQHDSVNRTDNGNNITLNFGGTFDAETSIQTDQGGHVELVNTTTYTLPDLPTDNVTGTGTPNTLPIWDATSQQLGDSIITQTLQGAIGQNNLQITNPNVTWSFNYGGSFKAVTGGGDTIFDLKQYDGSFFNKKIKFNDAVAIGQTTFPSSPVALSVAPTQSGDPAAYFKGGIVLSNNPGGVTVDNTSMVIGAGNNDIISGCDNSLAVGNGNQIRTNSDNTAAVGTNNTLSGAKNSLVVGLGNTISLSSPGHSIVQGQNNTLTNSFSSFVAGGNNAVNVGQNAFVLGYSHNLTGADSFVVLGENNESTGAGSDNNVYMIGGNLHGKDGTMVLGFRNDETSYPATDYAKGLGNTKFVMGVGTSSDVNALIITEGGVTRGGSGVTQKPRVVLPSIVEFDFVDDAAAAAGGIPVGGLYHSVGVIKIRRS